LAGPAHRRQPAASGAEHGNAHRPRGRRGLLQTAGREDLAGRSDGIIFEVACSEGRAVVTNNIKDFRPLAAEWLAQGRVLLA